MFEASWPLVFLLCGVSDRVTAVTQREPAWRKQEVDDTEQISVRICLICAGSAKITVCLSKSGLQVQFVFVVVNINTVYFANTACMHQIITYCILYQKVNA